MRYVLCCKTHDGKKVYCSQVSGALIDWKAGPTDTEFYADPMKAIRFEYDPKDLAQKLTAKKPAYSRAEYFTEKAPDFEEGQVVGHINLTEECVVERTYECAAWYTRIKLKPGKYEVVARRQDWGGRDWIFNAQIPGEVVSDYFQSLYCGVSIGSQYDTTKNKGKPEVWGVTWRPFYKYEADSVTKAWQFVATNLKMKEAV